MVNPEKIINNIIGKHKIKQDKYSSNMSNQVVLADLQWWWEHYKRMGSGESFEDYVYNKTGKSLKELEGAKR